MGKKSANKKSDSGGANLDFEAQFWLTADKLRNNMDAADYKHVVLGLIFLHDILRHVCEYFLTQFASAERKNGGQFYTPRCVVRVLVEMLAPYKGRVYNPCFKSASMFVQSERFVEEHGMRIGDIAVCGQESNSTTRRLAMMNLAIRGIEGDPGPVYADTFRRDLHPDLPTDYILASGKNHV